MIRFLVRKVAYGLAILAGINLFTFVLFFQVNTPDDMARMQLGGKRVTAQAIEKWKAERGYDRPLYFNSGEKGLAQVTNTVFMDSSLRMFAFDFGRADSGRDIGSEIKRRAGPSLALAAPTFMVGLGISITLALGLAFFRGTYLDFWGTVLCDLHVGLGAVFHRCRSVRVFKGAAVAAGIGLCSWSRRMAVFGVADCHWHHRPPGWRNAL